MINCEHSFCLSSFVFNLSMCQNLKNPNPSPFAAPPEVWAWTHASGKAVAEVSPAKASSPKQAVSSEQLELPPVPQGNGPSILWSLTSCY